MRGIGSCQEFLAACDSQMLGITRKALWFGHCSDPVSHSEDVVSEVKKKVVAKWGTLDSPEYALYTIIVNTARDHVRKCNAEVASEIHDSATPCFTQAGQDPEEMLCDAILIEELLAQLGTSERKVIELTFHEHSSAVIGEILDMPPNTVRSIRKRAIDKLKGIVVHWQAKKSET